MTSSDSEPELGVDGDPISGSVELEEVGMHTTDRDTLSDDSSDEHLQTAPNDTLSAGHTESAPHDTEPTQLSGIPGASANFLNSIGLFPLVTPKNRNIGRIFLCNVTLAIQNKNV